MGEEIDLSCVLSMAASFSMAAAMHYMCTWT